MLLARIQEKQVEGDRRASLSPEQIEQILVSFAKQRREAADAFDKAGREELRAKEMREHEIVRSYLPEQLDDAAIRAILREIMASTGASSPKDLGKVMGVAMQRLRGRADGARVQTRGDGRPEPDPWVPAENVIARVTHVEPASLTTRMLRQARHALGSLRRQRAPDSVPG